MIKGNKGEWSEIYTLLRILSDEKLFAGDSNLNKIENLIFPIVKILRDESHGTYEYSYAGDLVVIKGKKEEFRVPVADFTKQSVFLLSKLKEKTSSSFSVPEIEAFVNSFGCSSLKAKSTIKSDIRIIIHDQRTGTMPELGFSIKSQLGGASTLLNAGRTTNFIYRVDGAAFTVNEVAEINDIEGRSKIKDRIQKIIEHSNFLTFVKTESSVFGNNLTLIDSALPQILAEIVYTFYTTPITTMAGLVNDLAIRNPLKFNNETNHPFYHYKIKRFLTDIALGMMPSRVWTGELDATGGYLVVKDDGDILCYHIYNRNEFEDYLLNNTKLETASSGRHGFGILEKVDNELLFKLNLQIRFIK